MEIKVICPKCCAVVSVDTSDDASVCSKCGKAFITEKAVKANTAPAKKSSPDKDFKFTRDGGIERYLGKGGDVVIPDGVTYIAQHAFMVSKITSVYIPASVKKIELLAFMACDELTSVTVGSGVVEIHKAFPLCGKLKEIVFENLTGWEASELVTEGANSTLNKYSVSLSDPKANAKLLADNTRHISLYRNI